MILGDNSNPRPNRPVVIISKPQELVDLNIELPKIVRRENFSMGTYFNIQFVNHDKTKLLSSALFVVTEEIEKRVTSDDEYRPLSSDVKMFKTEMIGEWWYAPNSVEPADVMTATEVLQRQKLSRKRKTA